MQSKGHLFLRRIIRFFLLVLILGIVAHLFLADRNIYWQDFGFVSMSTWVKARFYVKDKQSVAQAARLVQDAFHEISQICNIYDQNSEIGRLNASAFQAPFPCSKDLWDILTAARKVHRLSGGAFDITIAPLLSLWGHHRQAETSPSEKDVEKTLQKIGMDKIIFDDQAHTVRFTVDGMKLDLGGIAKGAALDLAAERAVRTEIVGIRNAREATLFERLEARF